MSTAGRRMFLHWLCRALVSTLFVTASPLQAQTPGELYQKALKEGGTLNLYGTLTPTTADAVLPVFEKRFPGIKVQNTGASADKIVARTISEMRGGRTIGDVFHMNVENVMQVHEQCRQLRGRVNIQTSFNHSGVQRLRGSRTQSQGVTQAIWLQAILQQFG